MRATRLVSLVVPLLVVPGLAACLPPSPPAEKVTACQYQARQASTGRPRDRS